MDTPVDLLLSWVARLPQDLRHELIVLLAPHIPEEIFKREPYFEHPDVEWESLGKRLRELSRTGEQNIGITMMMASLIDAYIYERCDDDYWERQKQVISEATQDDLAFLKVFSVQNGHYKVEQERLLWFWFGARWYRLRDDQLSFKTMDSWAFREKYGRS